MRKVLPYLYRFGFATFVLACLLVFNKSAGIAQEAPQTWFDLTKNPALEQAAGAIPAAQFSSSVVLGYSPSCETRTVLSRNFSAQLGIFNQTTSACWIETSLGSMSKFSNQLVANGIVAGPVSNVPDPAYLRPSPKPGVFLEIKSNSSNPSNNWVKYHFGSQVSTSKNLIGNAAHTLSATDSFILKDNNGFNVSLASVDNINYSSAGKWAVGATQDYAMFRINMETKQILNFGQPMQHRPGFNPLMKMSVSGSGRYVVAAPTNPTGAQWVRLYDLSNCQGAEHPYVSQQHANCNYRDVTGAVKANIPNFNRITMAEFGSEDALNFYHVTAGGNPEYTKYVLRAPNSSAEPKSYIALGDSFVSGEGAYNYFRGTDEKGINLCHLSKESYPYLISKKLNLTFMKSVACSGAMMKNVVGIDRIEIIKEPITDENKAGRTNQWADYRDNANNELGSFLPGYYYQKRFVFDSYPDVITISIVGNDIGFDDKLKRCLMPDECYSTYEDRLEILREARGKFGDLVRLYEDIRSAGNKDAKIYVVGYPKVFKYNSSCGLNVVFNFDEPLFANQLLSQLNEVIKAAAKRAGVRYVDVENVFEGAELCSNSAAKAINGLTAGNDILGVAGNESYHPNKLGHWLYAQAIWDKTGGFTLPMLPADAGAQAPVQETDLDFLNRPKSYRSTASTFYHYGMTDDTVYKNADVRITAGDMRSFFAPNSTVRAELHSSPVSLGTFSANDLGGLTAMLHIPNSVEPGFHTIKLFGKDMFGKDIVFEKVVYAAHTPEDKNGNRIADSDEACGALAASGTDYDIDGTDDACDGEITEPKTIKEPEDPKPAKPPAEINPEAKPLPAEPVAGEVLGDSRTFIDGDVLTNQTKKLANTGSPVGLMGSLLLSTFLILSAVSLMFLNRLRYAKR